jgi:phosphocarrier protein
MELSEYLRILRKRWWIIALVTLAASLGTSVKIVAEGPDAGEAVGALAKLVEDRFGEGG